MSSYTTWSRLIPRTRNRQLTETLRAEVHDPLWLLGRQWQLGEFRGEDAGSPVKTKLELTSERMTRYRPKDNTSQTQEYLPTTNDAPPLETLVEREPVRLPLSDENRDIRRAADIGGQFLRMLSESEANLKVAVSDFESLEFPPIEVGGVSVEGVLLDEDVTDYDGDAKSFARIATGRTLDGDRLYAVFKEYEKGTLTTIPAPSSVPTDPSDPKFKTYEAALKSYCTRYETFYGEPKRNETAWDDDRLEYRFAVGLGPQNEQTVLEAPQYDGDGLDWPDFSVTPSESLEIPDGTGGSSAPRDTSTLFPTPSVARFRGMPATRWWEFEDGRVNMDALDASPEDLSRLLFLQFSLLYSNDWYNVPIELSVGTLTRVDSLTVTDTFGQSTKIESASSLSEADGDPWNMFAFMTRDADGEEASLFLPPVLTRSIERDPVEEVHFVRDDMVNLGWALETLVEGPLGLPLDRHEHEQQAETPPSPPALATPTTERRYRLATDVPDYWIPLLPEGNGSGAIRLRLGEMIDVADATQSDVRGRVLDPPSPSNTTIAIPEEEVPRQGTRVDRAYQLARWIDGATHLWSGRKRSIGAGEGRGGSGLRFDRTEESPTDHSPATPAPEMMELSRRTADSASDRPAPLSIATVETVSNGETDPNKERIVVQNVAEVSLDLTGWRIEYDEEHRYAFPNGFKLEPDEEVTLYSGSGSDGPRRLYWGKPTPFLGTAGVLFLYHLELVKARRPYPGPTMVPGDSSVVIGEIHPEVESAGSLNDEYITFVNLGEKPVEMGNWKIQNETGRTFIFPADFELAPSAIVRLRTGNGPSGAEDLYWGLHEEVWKETDGTAILFDESDRVRARMEY